jgi:hypothetical protein
MEQRFRYVGAIRALTFVVFLALAAFTAARMCLTTASAPSGADRAFPYFSSSRAAMMIIKNNGQWTMIETSGQAGRS